MGLCCATHRKTHTYALNKTQRLKSGFGFSIFWVWGFWVKVWVFCKSFANFELDYLKLNGYGFEYKFKKLLKKSKLLFKSIPKD